MSLTNCCASSYRFKDIKISNFYYQKLRQGHGMQFSQLNNPMVNVKTTKSLPHIFALALTVSKI